MSRGRSLPLLISLALGGGARAQEPPVDGAPAAAGVDAPLDDAAWTTGLVVAQVSLLAPDGGLPRENLEPLLRVEQGEPLDLALVRQDIALLMRAGEFAAVEVDAEPWLAFDDQGEPVDAVRVSYRVYPSPRIDRVTLDVPRGPARRVVRGAHRLGRGESFFSRRDGPATERRVREALVADGWPEPEVLVRTERVVDNDQEVHIAVEPGPERMLDSVVVASDLPLQDRPLRRALRGVGIEEGQRIPTGSVSEARRAVRDLLVGDGFLDPRVTLLFSPAPEGGERLAILGEAGPRTEVVAVGRGVPYGERLAEIIGLQPGTRVSEGMIEDIEVALERWFQTRGYWAAQVDARVTRAGDDALVVLDADRGPRYRVADYDIDGADALEPDTIRAALQEAAPGSLGRRVVVDRELPGAARALTELYRGRGYLDATVTIDPPEPGTARWRPPFGRVVTLTLPVHVEEEARTRLVALEVVGGDVAAAEAAAEARARLEGEAYRPGELDRFRQSLVEGLRSRGFLDADATLKSNVAEQEATARIVVQTGEEVRLRSITIQGNRRTRRSVIAREIAVEVGQPLTPEDLEVTRRRLYDLDLFRAVTLDLIGEDPRARDLIVRVEERPPILFQVGGGVATDRGVTARGRVAHRNLAGRGQSLGLLGQAGYTWSGDDFRLDLSDPTWKAALRYEAPNIPTHGQRFVAEAVLNETLQETEYRIYDSGLTVGIRSRLGPRDEAFFSYGVRWRRLDDIDPGALVTGDPWLQALGMDSVDDRFPTIVEGQRLLSGPSVALILDHRDSALDPRRGWRSSTLLEGGDSIASGTVTLKAESRFEQLVGLGPLILSLGGYGGIGWAQGDQTTLGVEDRFVLGGSGSLRGFRPGTVSPVNEEPRPDVDMPDEIEPLVSYGALADDPTHMVPTGGDAVVSGSVELRVPLSAIGFPSFDNTFVVGFVDVGRVGFVDPDVQPTSRVEGTDPLARVGTGGGLRISTPVGPVALLLGVNPEPIEARDEPSFVVHFTLGDL